MKEKRYSGEHVIEANIYRTEKKYWLDKLKGSVSKALFSYDYVNSADKVFSKYSISIGNQLLDRFNKVSSGQDKRLHMVLMALVSELLRRYSSEEDIIIGTPIYKQEIEEEFINTVLPVRNNIDSNQSFKTFLLNQLRPTVIDAIKNQNYPYKAMLYQLGLEGDQNSLFDVALILENIQDISYINTEYYNFLFSFSMGSEKMEFTIHYDQNKYSIGTIKQIAQHFVRLSDLCLHQIDQPMSSLSLINEEEETKILKVFNHIQEPSDFEFTVDEIFHKIAIENPNKKAVVFKENSLTYKELDDRSDKLCAYLRSRNVKTGSIVGIEATYSLELIVGLLAILKCGAVYLPINTDYPDKRIKLLISDGNVKWFLKTSYEIDLKGLEKIDLRDEINYQLEKSFEPGHDPNEAAYIIYTSGSTGNPKGVIVEHKSINRLVRNTNILKFEDSDKILQTGALEFDASTFEIWGALLNGLTLFLAPDKLILNHSDLLKIINENMITIMWLTSSLFNQIIESTPKVFDNLKFLLVGGEKLSTYHVNKLRDVNKNINIINGYGPTENTTFSVTHLIDKEYKENIPIGVPIKNSSVFILDNYGKMEPIGVAGELCVGGVGLSRGYLNNPELTHDKFIPNQYLPNTILYKTGDLAYWDEHGIIEFIGRKDAQLKIRGYRIEPGEIEDVIRRIDGVNDVAVIDWLTDDNEVKLCAYIVGLIDLQEIDIRDILKTFLPDYMIPSFYTKVDQIELTSNGKVNKKALPEPRFEDYCIIKPNTEVEKRMIKIWAEILGITEDNIGINSNFFDLGGHSLKATTLVNQLYKEFNKKIPLIEVFNSQTIKDLSKYIEKIISEEYQSIPKADEKDFYDLSSAQHRLFVLQQMDLNQTNYNIPLFLILEGNVVRERIEETFKRIIERHEILRTSIKFEKNKPVQYISQNVDFSLKQFPQDKSIEELINDFVYPFDLSKAPLIRVGLKELDPPKSLLLIDIHHVVVDGSSLSLLVKELMEIYSGKEPEPVKLAYKDFSEWQNKSLSSAEVEKQKLFWLNKLNGELPVIQLPYDFKRPLMQSFEGAEYDFEINQSLTESLKEFKGEKGTMFMVLLAIYNVFLSKLSNSEDIIIGSPIAGRQHPELASVFGLFVNTIVFRNKPLHHIQFSTFLEQVIDESIGCFENQGYQFEKLINDLNLFRDTGRNPLFDVAITFHNEIKPEEITNISTNELQLRPYLEARAFRASKFDLMLCIKESDDKLLLSFEYCTKLFKKSTIKRFIGYFMKIVETIISKPEICIQDITIATKEDIDIQLDKLNRKECARFLNETTIHKCFENQVSKNPDRIALSFNNHQISYKELNIKANKIANFLIGKGVQENQIIGLHFERSPELVIGILGVLKSGAGYLPIDPLIPEKRKKFMVKDSELEIILTNITSEFDPNVDFINIEGIFKNSKKDLNPLLSIPSASLAYVIYTSGSTGYPKGVVISHKNVMSLLKNEELQFDFEQNDVWTLFHSYSFDFSVWEIFGSLLNSSRLIIVPENERKNPEAILNLLEEEHVSVFNQTPSAFINLNNYILRNNCKQLHIKYLVFGGEALSPKILQSWNELYPFSQIINMYGITETTVHVTYKEIGSLEINENTSNIGKPVPCLKTYVLNQKNQILPVGIEGEICIEGEGLSSGYLNNPELTADVFIKSPFSQDGFIYKSGDLGILNQEGEIIYTGRNDKQVKIRGFRIELPEIQKNLMHIKQVEEAVVILDDDQGDSKISAYLRLKEPLFYSYLRTFLIDLLPEYMIPSKFFETKNFPLTSQGKLDIEKLKQSSNEIYNKLQKETTDTLEEKIISIVSNLLQKDIKTISIYDDFFEIGGHSLIATQLVLQIEKELGFKIHLTDVFRNPILKNLADLVRKSTMNKEFSHLKKAEKKEYYNLSPAQRRLFVLNQLDQSSIAYNMPLFFRLENEILIDKYKAVLERIVDRHESLRSYFGLIGGKEVQFIKRKIEINLDVFNIGSREELVEVYKSFVKPFDLSQCPLFRVAILNYCKKETYMLFDIHHIISDGISQQILVKEFNTIQKNKLLNKLTYQYKDFAEWIFHNDKSNSESFWLNMYKEGVPISDFPLDYERKNKMSFTGKREYFILPDDLTNRVKEFVKQNNLTLNAFLYSTYSLLLNKISYTDDFVIGTVVGNRQHADLQSLIGFFVNILAIRFKIDTGNKVIDYLKNSKELILQSYEKQDYPFDTLIQELKIKRELNKHPLVENVFAYYDVSQDNKGIEENGSSTDLVKEMYNNYSVSHFDLMLYAIKNDNQISLFFEYLIDLYSDSTIKDMIESYCYIISQIVNDKSILIDDIKLKSGLKKILLEEGAGEVSFKI